MTSSNTKRLYIGNLDSTVDEYAVVKLFEPHGKITFLDYMFHWNGPKKGQPRGYCFLEYEKKEAALNAISALHGRIVKGRPLVVSFAHMNTEQEDRRGQTSSGAQNRPNAFTILRTQRMANASTDARIQAIERKLATLQSKSSTPANADHGAATEQFVSKSSLSPTPSSATMKSPSLSTAVSSSSSHPHHQHPRLIRSATSGETNKYPSKSTTKDSSPSSSTSFSSASRRYKPY
ncbi:hypothetical protein BDB00DRAFT_826591 [Zychaea mexicana]|uniref:uncharacterized protein n=1 Tax=Zychaea mexicana TaxID=64656 RepID=UPI0022FE002B|nr:uncharacterized protein BDB00DRAFT_826591 [Zychaea mexicana]KAI9492832.1 hypothetical protein BDB00DRAFT_826591 [Zychaea mexicana]